MNNQIANGMVLCEHYLSVHKYGTELAKLQSSILYAFINKCEKEYSMQLLKEMQIYYVFV